MVNIDIAEIIRVGRAKKNISQTKLARRIDISKSAVSDWENGNRIPAGEFLIRLANELDIVPNLFPEWDCKRKEKSVTDTEVKTYHREIDGKHYLVTIHDGEEFIAEMTQTQKAKKKTRISVEANSELETPQNTKNKGEDKLASDEDETSKDMAELVKGAKKRTQEKLEKKKKGPGVKA